MADLSGGVGQARAQNGRNTGSTLPVPTSAAPRVKSPREIMRLREVREDNKRREALRKLEEERQNRGNERLSDQNAGVGGAGEGIENRRTSARQSYGIQEPKSGDNGRGDYLQGAVPQQLTVAGGRGDTRATGEGGTRLTSQALPQPARQPPTRRNAAAPPQQLPRVASGPPPQPAAAAAAAARNSGEAVTNPTQPRNSANGQARNSSTTFPHAFERWETLSSHWEGLTSFWIKRLQGNSEELRDQPINQQLARQVTDLSAAGANLFHAVVELQRLRASSERKFQRWFFETRAEQEKTAERMAQLENEVAEARQGQPATKAVVTPTAPSVDEIRKQAERLAADEIEKVRRECALQIKEKNRELEISREEARRGWEEIGRMEQENRDRTFSLRRGEPTVLGGVQVVPLLAEGSRHVRAQSGGLSSHPTADDPDYANYDAARSEADTDPFTESGRDVQSVPHGLPTSPRQPQSSSAAIQAARTRTTAASPARPQTAGQPFASSSVYPSEPLTAATSGGFYQQSGAGTTLHPIQSPTRGQDERSYVASELSEEDYEGQGVRDQYGNPTTRGPPSEISDEYDVLQRLEQDQLFTRGYHVDPAQAQRYTAASNGESFSAPDYSGAGYGDRDWQSAVPRHHHPSRLSDVLEEDERSRTSETSRRIPH